jgi:hypothetical protein
VVIGESMKEKNRNPGMLLSFSLEPDLSHAPIPYTIIFYNIMLYESNVM